MYLHKIKWRLPYNVKYRRVSQKRSDDSWSLSNFFLLSPVIWFDWLVAVHWAGLEPVLDDLLPKKSPLIQLLFIMSSFFVRFQLIVASCGFLYNHITPSRLASERAFFPCPSQKPSEFRSGEQCATLVQHLWWSSHANPSTSASM